MPLTRVPTPDMRIVARVGLIGNDEITLVIMIAMTLAFWGWCITNG